MPSSPKRFSRTWRRETSRPRSTPSRGCDGDREPRGSKTFACKELGISRNSLKPLTIRKSSDPVIRRWLRLFARKHPRWGWRKAFWTLRHKDVVINHKKLRRLWREEGLCRKRKNRKQRCQKPQVKV